MLRLFVSDLDGTFLDADGQVTAENAAAVRAARAAGVRTVFATGRPARWLDVLEPLLDVDPFVICSNGAVTYDLGAGSVVHAEPVDPAVALDVARDLRAAVPDVRFACERGLSWAAEDGYPRRADRPGPELAGPLEQLVGEPFVKLIAVSPSLHTDALAHAAAPTVDGRLTLTWSFLSTPGLLELSAPGICKASGLLSICAELGVDPADAAAFGDMPNDLELLRLVGRPFVMADAHPLLLAEGFPTAGAHTDSGVGRTMMALLAEG